MEHFHIADGFMNPVRHGVYDKNFFQKQHKYAMAQPEKLRGFSQVT